MAAAGRARTRLEQKLQSARLSQRDVLRRFPIEASRLGEGEFVISDRQLKRWLAGGAPTPRPAACRVLEGWFGEPVERLLGPPDEIAAIGVAAGGEAVAEAGKRSVEHAIEAASALDPSALEHLQAAAEKAARDCLITPPLQMLTELVQLRDTVYAQLDRTNKPRQQTELYLLAGLCCGLLSSVSFDLGHPDVAMEQACAAHTYGSLIDHPSVCAWARGWQATIAMWSGQARRAVVLTEAAFPDAPAGTAQVRLHSIRARALSRIGARQEVSAELTAAANQLEAAGSDEFLDGIGGKLSFDQAPHALYASTAYVWMNDGDHAEPAAARAIRAFAELPPNRRWESGAVAATIDLGTARMLCGDLAGCEAAINEVLLLPAAKRTEGVAQRLLDLRRLVRAPSYRKAVEAQRLGERIEEFTVVSLGRTTARLAIAPRV